MWPKARQNQWYNYHPNRGKGTLRVDFWRNITFQTKICCCCSFRALSLFRVHVFLQMLIKTVLGHSVETGLKPVLFYFRLFLKASWVETAWAILPSMTSLSHLEFAQVSVLIKILANYINNIVPKTCKVLLNWPPGELGQYCADSLTNLEEHITCQIIIT